MPFFTRFFGGVIVAIALASLICGNEPASVPTNAPADLLVPDEAPALIAEIAEPPKHFILNPDLGRPPEYPLEIALQELEDFLKTQRMTGQGCGGMTWEGAACGMYSNGYAAAKTPWLNDPVGFNACYAQTKTGTFLSRLTLGRNTYARSDRESDKLTWERNYEVEYQEREIRQVLFGSDSGRRKELLTKIRDSLENMDVALFPASARESLCAQLQPCEKDQDPAVADLAKRLRALIQP